MLYVTLPFAHKQSGLQAAIGLEDGGRYPAATCVPAIPDLLNEGMGPMGLARLNAYRSAIIHGFYTDAMRPGESEHLGPWAMPGSIDPLYGLSEHVRNHILWLHADRVSGRLGGPNDGA